jgi:hypothetical protein
MQHTHDTVCKSFDSSGRTDVAAPPSAEDLINQLLSKNGVEKVILITKTEESQTINMLDKDGHDVNVPVPWFNRPGEHVAHYFWLTAELQYAIVLVVEGVSFLICQNLLSRILNLFWNRIRLSGILRNFNLSIDTTLLDMRLSWTNPSLLRST